MTLNDPLANVLSQIKNYEQTGKKEVHTKHSSKIIKNVLNILQKEGYIGEYKEIEDRRGNQLIIQLLGRINNIGVIKPRFHVTKEDYEKYEKRFLPAKDFGVLILTTNQGFMTHEEAKEKGIGGVLIAYCY